MSRPSPPREPSLASLFRAQSGFVWGLAYRMTGSAADADDILQETFARVLDHEPETERDLAPWLTVVATNLARDALRRRRRAPYTGPWLPSPVDEEPLDAPDASALLERREGATYAFLLALEALTPQQRGVLLLRDVFERSVAETAVALGISAVRVKVTHHRARARLAAVVPHPSERPPADATLASLSRFVAALAAGDEPQLLACFTEQARVLSDGGGEFMAALRPVYGKERVARFFLGLRRKLGDDGVYEVRHVNGEPALVAEQRTPVARAAPRWLLRVELAPDGRIRELHLVVASRKLTHVRRVGAASRAPAA